MFELLVSISIIGILVAVASVSYSGAQKKARDARRKEDMGLIQKAAEQFYSQNNFSYPTSDTTPWTPTSGTATLEVFPSDPKNDATYYYSYSSPSPYSTYCACARLDNATGNSNDRSCNLIGTGNGQYYCVKNQQ